MSWKSQTTLPVRDWVFKVLFILDNGPGHSEHWVQHWRYQSDQLAPSSVQFSSVAQSCQTLRRHGLQHTRPPYPSPTPRAYSNSCPLSRWCHPTISSSHPLLLLPSPFPASGSFLMSQFFQWILKTDFFEDWLVLSPCSPRDPQESSPTPQLKSINYLELIFHYSPNLTSIRDYCKNHSSD